jgi:uncharacterized protein YndB with AHSA1/START domain
MSLSEMMVRREITVNASVERAFDVFTAKFDTWWPRGHHIGKAEMKEAILEPRAGGRWYERGVDGSECLWGHVLAWEPPHRLIVSWHLDGAFTFDPDPAHASEVEVRFVATGPKTTQVTLEHRNLERHGASAAALRDGISGEGGWAGLLKLFAEKATA